VTGGIAAAHAEAARQAWTFSSSGLSVTEVPLVSIVAVQADDERLVLAMAMHHLIFDGPSMAVFRAELLELTGQPDRRLAPSSSYQEFVRWSLAYESSAEGRRDQAYWRDAVRHFGPGCHLARIPAPADEVAGQYRMTLPTVTRDAALLVARRLRVFDFAVRATALFALCHAVYGLDDVCMLMPVDMRMKYVKPTSMGMFINFVPVWHKLVESETIAECVTSTAEQIARSLAHGAFGLDKIAAASPEGEYEGRFPFTGVLINTERVGQLGSPAATRPVPETAGRQVAFDFQVYFTDAPDRTDVALQYSPAALDGPDWARALERYVAALHHIGNLPGTRFADLAWRE
jgi:hypothetical protein